MLTVSRGLYNWLFRSAPMLEDFADRLSHVWTCGLLLLLACIIGWKQQPFNKPVTCFCPAEFTDSMVAYTHSICQDSEYLYNGHFDDIPMYESSGKLESIWVYKWLPLLLCLQALLFKLPNIVMYVLHGYSGISFEKIASLSEGYQNLTLEERTLLGKQTGRYLYNWCTQFGTCLPWRLVSISWFLVKILFFVNALIQLISVDKLLSTRNPPFDNSTSYGDTIYNNLFNSSALEWKQSPLFPRVVLCRYDIRPLRNVHKFDVQCNFPVNEFNENVYMFVWMWLLVVTVVSFLSLAVWLVLTLIPVSRQRSMMVALSDDSGASNAVGIHQLSSLIGEDGVIVLFSMSNMYVSRMLALSEEPGASNAAVSNQLSSLIGEDGVMVLKLISANSSEHLVRDVVAAMYQLAQRQMPYSYPPVATQPAQPSAPTGATSGGMSQVLT